MKIHHLQIIFSNHSGGLFYFFFNFQSFVLFENPFQTYKYFPLFRKMTHISWNNNNLKNLKKNQHISLDNVFPPFLTRFCMSERKLFNSLKSSFSFHWQCHFVFVLVVFFFQFRFYPGRFSESVFFSWKNFL